MRSQSKKDEATNAFITLDASYALKKHDNGWLILARAGDRIGVCEAVTLDEAFLQIKEVEKVLDYTQAREAK